MLQHFFFGGWLFGKTFTKNQEDTNIPYKLAEKPYEKYTIDSLSEYDSKQGSFILGDNMFEDEKIISHKMFFSFYPDPAENYSKTISGQLNIPQASGKYPLIIMLRGYVNQEVYKTGDGTRNTSYYFAENGFITLAPDFLGYAESDEEAANIFESRFQTYTTALSLIKSVNTSSFRDAIDDKWDQNNIFIWGHSNGGQIALTLLEITSDNIPTVLWAPVSKPFPYSVLYYTDESDDHGKLIRNELAIFESDYNVDKYSLTEHFNLIKAPIQLHQGAADIAVPKRWSDQLNNYLKSLDVSVNYYKYPNTDHNMKPMWDSVVVKDVEFYNSHTEDI